MVRLQGRVGWMGRALGWVVLVVTAKLLAGCGDLPAAAPQSCDSGEVAREDGGCEPRKPCAPGELTLASGECQPAGLPPDMQCPPGELALADGGCQPAGVPPEACAEGFAPDGRGGCEALLPAEPCPWGMMAIPGDTACREVAPCGDGPWGSIPVEASTQFVDQAYAGGDSDGTAARPWTRVQDGVDAAEEGAIVAVTDGTYVEDVLIQDKAVRLWGRCPGRVEILGTGVELGAIAVFTSAADGVQIRGLSVAGAKNGIVVFGATGVVIDAVRVHDAAERGLIVEDVYGATSVTVTGSLIEGNHDVGVFVFGSHAEIASTVVRSTLPLSNSSGLGISIQNNQDTHGRSSASVHTCLIEENHDVGLYVQGSDAKTVATVVRSTQSVNGRSGLGIAVQDGVNPGERAAVSVRACLVEQNLGMGVFVGGSDMEVEATVVRATRPLNGVAGVGVLVSDAPDTGERADATFRACLVEQSHAVGVIVQGSDVDIEATVVRSTLPANGELGRGIVIQDHLAAGERANAMIRACLVEQNHDVGVFVGGSTAVIEATVVRSTQPVDSHGGDGISIQNNPDSGTRAEVIVSACLVEQNHAHGMFIGASDAEVEATVVRSTQPVSGHGGRGIGIQSDPSTGAPADVSIRSCIVDLNHEVGVFVSQSDTAMEGTVVRSTWPGNGHGGHGIQIQGSLERLRIGAASPEVSIRECLVENNHEIGVAVVQAFAELEATTVRMTKANDQQAFGDGVAIINGAALIQASDITRNARAGIASFGSRVKIVSTTATCNEFDINGEIYRRLDASFDGSEDWRCSRHSDERCTETKTCVVTTARLVPPSLY